MGSTRRAAFAKCGFAASIPTSAAATATAASTGSRSNWLYHNAQRDGLPIDRAAIATNLVDQTLPQQISDHKVEVGPPRHIFDTDLLHLSVVLNPGIPGRPHNNPRMPLSRIDDGGQIFEPV